MKRLLFETAALTLVASVALGAPIPAGPVFEDGGIALQALLDQLTVGGLLVRGRGRPARTDPQIPDGYHAPRAMGHDGALCLSFLLSTLAQRMRPLPGSDPCPGRTSRRDAHQLDTKVGCIPKIPGARHNGF